MIDLQIMHYGLIIQNIVMLFNVLNGERFFFVFLDFTKKI